MSLRNLIYAQAGGVTAVINASAAAVIREARANADAIGQVFGARRGILGLLEEDLVDTAGFGDADLDALERTPGGAFGSCRFDLDALPDNPAQYDRLFEVFAAHRIGYFLYNGGNGSMETVLKVADAARVRGYPLVCVGVPKTVDNDLVGTDCSPGFGSAAKYVATSMLEAGLDLAAMSGSRVRGRAFVMEVMGRNAGWIAASTALAAHSADDPPHLILMPEVAFDEERFLHAVEAVVARLGYCAITVAEGIRRADGALVMEQSEDAKGHVQLGGAGQAVARLIDARLGYKHHWAIPDYLQRAAGHLVSGVDREQACAVGAAAVRLAVSGRNAVMPAIRRLADEPYAWDVEAVDLAGVANLEKCVPPGYIRTDGMHVTPEALRYLRPLVMGEVWPPFAGGLPYYPQQALRAVPRKLPAWSA